MWKDNTFKVKLDQTWGWVLTRTRSVFIDIERFYRCIHVHVRYNEILCHKRENLINVQEWRDLRDWLLLRFNVFLLFKNPTNICLCLYIFLYTKYYDWMHLKWLQNRVRGIFQRKKNISMIDEKRHLFKFTTEYFM